MSNPPRPGGAPSELDPTSVRGRVAAMVEPPQEPTPVALTKPPVAAHEPLITFATRLPLSMPKRLRRAALDQDRTVQSIVQEALAAWLTGE